jgi:chromosome segregation ATPase
MDKDLKLKVEAARTEATGAVTELKHAISAVELRIDAGDKASAETDLHLQILRKEYTATIKDLQEGAAAGTLALEAHKAKTDGTETELRLMLTAATTRLEEHARTAGGQLERHQGRIEGHSETLADFKSRIEESSRALLALEASSNAANGKSQSQLEEKAKSFRAEQERQDILIEEQTKMQVNLKKTLEDLNKSVTSNLDTHSKTLKAVDMTYVSLEARVGGIVKTMDLTSADLKSQSESTKATAIAIKATDDIAKSAALKAESVKEEVKKLEAQLNGEKEATKQTKAKVDSSAEGVKGLQDALNGHAKQFSAYDEIHKETKKDIRAVQDMTGGTAAALKELNLAVNASVVLSSSIDARTSALEATTVQLGVRIGEAATACDVASAQFMNVSTALTADAFSQKELLVEASKSAAAAKDSAAQAEQALGLRLAEGKGALDEALTELRGEVRTRLSTVESQLKAIEEVQSSSKSRLSALESSTAAALDRLARVEDAQQKQNTAVIQMATRSEVETLRALMVEMQANMVNHAGKVMDAVVTTAQSSAAAAALSQQAWASAQAVWTAVDDGASGDMPTDQQLKSQKSGPTSLPTQMPIHERNQAHMAALKAQAESMQKK